MHPKPFFARTFLSEIFVFQSESSSNHDVTLFFPTKVLINSMLLYVLKKKLDSLLKTVLLCAESLKVHELFGLSFDLKGCSNNFDTKSTEFASLVCFKG